MTNRKYFIADDNEKKGPFTYLEILEFKLPGDTLIWKEGLISWLEIQHLEEFRETVLQIPPPIPLKRPADLNINVKLEKTKNSIERKKLKLQAEKVQIRLAKELKFNMLLLLLCLVLGVTVFIKINYIDNSGIHRRLLNKWQNLNEGPSENDLMNVYDFQLEDWQNKYPEWYNLTQESIKWGYSKDYWYRGSSGWDNPSHFDSYERRRFVEYHKKIVDVGHQQAVDQSKRFFIWSAIIIIVGRLLIIFLSITFRWTITKSQKQL